MADRKKQQDQTMRQQPSRQGNNPQREPDVSRQARERERSGAGRINPEEADANDASRRGGHSASAVWQQGVSSAPPRRGSS